MEKQNQQPGLSRQKLPYEMGQLQGVGGSGGLGSFGYGGSRLTAEVRRIGSDLEYGQLLFDRCEILHGGEVIRIQDLTRGSGRFGFMVIRLSCRKY